MSHAAQTSSEACWKLSGKVHVRAVLTLTLLCPCRRKFEDMAGPVMEVERHAPSRSALVEMKQ